MIQKTKLLFIILLAIFIITLPNISLSKDIDSLLAEYAQKADLSAQTKKESAGYVIIFTRADLDRMKIRSLNELINKIPFLRYNENHFGLSDIDYKSYQENTFNKLIIYLNDRELTTPFNGNAFQAFGQMNTDYVDHIEVYIGLPSYEIGFETAAVVIKIYTKKGYRENTSVLGNLFGTYGTKDIYLYTANSYKDISYLSYANYRKLKRKKIYHNGSTLSKDKRIVNIYSEAENDNFRFESQYMSNLMDTFAGVSWGIDPTTNKTGITYLYSGLYYKTSNNNFKAYLNYSYITTRNTQISPSPLNLLKIPTNSPPFYTLKPYYKLNYKMKENFANAALTKKIKPLKKLSIILGIKGKYAKFKFKTFKGDGIDIPTGNYNKETILGIYIENRYLINQKNMLIASIKSEKYFENGNIQDMHIYTERLGYIFNNGNISFKTFLFNGGFAPSPYVLFYQQGFGPNVIHQQKGVSLSGELTYKHNSSIYSLFYENTRYKNMIYFDLNEYQYANDPHKRTYNSLSFRYTYKLNSFDKIDLNAWIYNLRTHGQEEINGNYIGCYADIFKKTGNFNIYAILAYKNGYKNTKASFNLDTTISYMASKKLTIFLKGNNLLNKAITTNYYRINLLSHKITSLNDVNVFDRSIWVGMEYRF